MSVKLLSNPKVTHLIIFQSLQEMNFICPDDEEGKSSWRGIVIHSPDFYMKSYSKFKTINCHFS